MLGGEFPAWDATLERKAVLPARMDAVLFPLAPGSSARPSVKRLLTDARTTAFRIEGEDIDDTFILCEEGAAAVTVDGTFEGRALLVCRQPALKVMAVAPVSVMVDDKTVA